MEPTADVVVIGAGITGLAVAWGLVRRDPSLRVRVLEASALVGGNLRTEEVDGFTVDYGPNGFLAKGDATLRLCERLGLRDALVPASLDARYRYVFRRGRLVAIPTSPLGMARSPLIGLRGLREMLGEPFRPPRTAADEEETVSAFLRRRMGARVADELAAPMVAGITGGDARTVSVDALFPRLVELEAQGGSLTRGALGAAWRARRSGTQRPKTSYAASRTLTFDRGGMGRLPAALAQALGDRVATEQPVCAVRPTAEATDGARWAIETVHGASVRARHVVLSVPAHQAARLVEGALAAACNDLAAIPYAAVRVLALGYPRAHVPHDLRGFGYLVARGEAHRSLGCLWTSSIFPHQAPAGHVALRVIGGGANDPSFAALDDEHALLAVQRDLRASMGIQHAPVFVRQIVWPQAIPQYGIGHVARIQRLDRMFEEQAAGLHLASNAYHGVAVNDCTARAERVVDTIIGTGER
jgi:oxygen-dependent protoporphyrinogen oxidase